MFRCLSDSDKDTNEVWIRVVRDVGPQKDMFCVSFCLLMQVAGVEKLVLTNNSGDAAENTNGKRERKKGNADMDSSNMSK